MKMTAFEKGKVWMRRGLAAPPNKKMVHDDFVAWKVNKRPMIDAYQQTCMWFTFHMTFWYLFNYYWSV